MATSHLREGDLDLLLRVIEDARHDDAGEAMPWALLEGLQRLVPCDWDVSYQHHDYVGFHTLVMQGVEDDDTHEGPDYPDPDSADDPFWRYWWRGLCSYPQRSGDLRTVIHTGDFFPTERERLADPMSEILPDIKCSMIVSLPAPPGEARRVIFMRESGPSFTERDRQVAALLRPHVEEIWLDAERRRNGVPQLTAREWQVLGMAAAGLSYAQIAHELFVTVSTVRKHMEHVRERLGVHTVAAAAALAMPHAPRTVAMPRSGEGSPPERGAVSARLTAAR